MGATLSAAQRVELACQPWFTAMVALRPLACEQRKTNARAGVLCLGSASISPMGRSAESPHRSATDHPPISAAQQVALPRGARGFRRSVDRVGRPRCRCLLAQRVRDPSGVATARSGVLALDIGSR